MNSVKTPLNCGLKLQRELAKVEYVRLLQVNLASELEGELSPLVI